MFPQAAPIQAFPSNMFPQAAPMQAFSSNLLSQTGPVHSLSISNTTTEKVSAKHTVSPVLSLSDDVSKEDTEILNKTVSLSDDEGDETPESDFNLSVKKIQT